MGVLQGIVQIYIYVLLARAILSWFVQPSTTGALADVNRILVMVTEPLLAPLRRILPMLRVGTVGLDMSIFLLVLILYVVKLAI